MACFIVSYLLILYVLQVRAQSTCTTLQPVFADLLDSTSTVYASTATVTSTVSCSGCSLTVETFRPLQPAITTTPSTTATTTLDVTTSAFFTCGPETLTSSPTASPPAGTTDLPTASPLPPVVPTVQTFINELRTAILYASLISNGGDQAKLCSNLNPSGFSNITGVDGTVVQQEVCMSAAIQFQFPSLANEVFVINQAGVSYLETALFAVEIAGNFAGGANLATLCTEIEAKLIDNLFVGSGYGTVGSAIKTYICSAANTTSTTNSTTPSTCSTLGFANTVVPVPIAHSNFNLDPAFTAAHLLFERSDQSTLLPATSILLPQATIARSCLDQCIEYQLTTGVQCAGIFVNEGKPYPPLPAGQDQSPRWYCRGYDAALSVGLFGPANWTESYRHGLAVNRVCGGDFRAF